MKSIFNQPKLSQSRKNNLESFQKKAGIRFKNILLLDTAFTHRSFANEVSKHIVNNERLEFLGDSVLGLVVANYLFEHFPNDAEGELAKTKSVVVSEPILAEIALSIGVPSCLTLGKGEEKSGGRQKKAILADAVEAIIGALYLDSGLKEVEKFIIRIIEQEIKNVHSNKNIKDYKSLLQEYYQKKHKSVPIYKMEKKTGPDHDQTFWVSVSLGATKYGPTQGKSKKEAEQKVAQFAWERVSEN